MLVFSLSLIINLYFVIPAVITKTFNPNAKLAISISIPSKQTKSEIETHPVGAESAQYNLKTYKLFCPSYSLSRF